MISILVSSIDEQKLKRFSESLRETIGSEYELLVHNNAEGLGLCRVYNLLAARAKYGLLCFIHEDMVFHTTNWGFRLKAHLLQPSCGVVGIMGGTYKSRFGLDWKDGTRSMQRAHVKDGVQQGEVLNFNPASELRSRVLCLDGAFLACRKEVWQSHPFDEASFKRFHFYDMDFSMAAGRYFHNYVVFDILTEHFSQGRMDKDYLEQSLVFEKKWEASLPAGLETLSTTAIRSLEGYNAGKKLALMKQNGFRFRERWQLLMTYFRLHKSSYHFIRSFYFGFVKP